MTRIDGNVSVSGTVTATRNNAPTARSVIDQEALVEYAVPLTDLVVHDDIDTKLPETAAADDLGLTEGTFLTSAPMLEGVDAGGVTNSIQYGRFFFFVPPEYDAGQSILLQINANMEVVADATAVLDVQCVRQAAPSVDLCATSSQSINSATAADKEFTITATNVVVGDVLDVRIWTDVTDAGNASANINSQINSIAFLLDIRG